MIKLTHFKQKRPGLCGPVSLQMVLNYYKVTVSANQLAKISGASEEQGMSMDGFIKAARHFNFQVFYKENGTIEDLKYFAKKNIPVIVDWFLDDDGHYSVVVDVTDKNVILMDPVLSKILVYTQKRIIPIKKFYRIWFDFPGDFIKEAKEVILRRLIVLTPFGEKFLIAGKYLADAPGASQLNIKEVPSALKQPKIFDKSEKLAGKKFQKRVEDFICQKCGHQTKGSGYTDHCPKCLWSKHVDINPGDRQSSCRSLMEPVAAEAKKDNYTIYYKCVKCGFAHRVKSSPDDNLEEIIRLTKQPFGKKP